MEYTVQPELTVSGRSAQLRQVADILLDNAVKYADPGSPIQMGLRREGRNAVLWVENRSAPIPPEKLGHLFDRFYRVDESRTGGEGFGLGLAIARTIVQSHRGSIGCTSAQGVTRFTVTLPLAKNEVTKEEAKHDRSFDSGRHGGRRHRPGSLRRRCGGGKRKNRRGGAAARGPRKAGH
ncbi:MAG: sensor histidine kinase [Oscillospiraceae bacterium]